MRAIEQWRILVPEIQQTQKLMSGYYPFTYLSVPFDAWSTLARPVLSYPELASNPSSVTLSSGSFDRLSNELIDEIIGYLLPPNRHCGVVSPAAVGTSSNQVNLTKQNTLAFGRASQRLWILVLRHIHISLINVASPWAGKKICYQSSFSRHLPAQFEQDGLVEQTLGSAWDPEGSHSLGRKFWYKHTSYPMPIMVKEEQKLWIQALVQTFGITQSVGKAKKKRKRDPLIPKQLGSGATQERFAILEKQLRGLDLFPQNRVWVLRNLTSREVVFSEDQPPSEGSVLLNLRSRSKKLETEKKPKTEKLKKEKETCEYFNFLVLERISWRDEGRDGYYCRGKWAGNRLEIVEKSIHDEEGGEWKDITRKVEGEVRNLRKKLRIK